MITPEKLRACVASATRNHQWAPVTVQDCPMLADAMEIADSCARSDIESFCNGVGHAPAGHRQYDIHAVVPDEPIVKETVAIAVRYLEARELLIRQEGAPHIVSFREWE